MADCFVMADCDASSPDVFPFHSIISQPFLFQFVCFLLQFLNLLVVFLYLLLTTSNSYNFDHHLTENISQTSVKVYDINHISACV